MNFSFWFKTKSWQSVLTADVDAAIKHAITRAGEERRINLIDCEASLDHVLMSIGGRNGGRQSGAKHLVTGASARFKLRAAPDIRFDAGVANFWQKRNTLNLTRPSPVATGGGPSETGRGDPRWSPIDAS